MINKNNLGLPVDKQVEMLLDGTIKKYIEEKFGKNIIDVRPYLDLKRDDVRKYLQLFPDKIQKYYEKHSNRPYVHEQLMIQKRGEKYIVFSVDHGGELFPKKFDDLSEAVIEHVLVDHMMY